MKIFNTKCEKCIFKITNDTKQIGCQFDIENIITKNYPGLYSSNNFIKENFWTIKNFRCPYARTEQWLELLNTTTSENAFDRVIADSVVPCYLVVLMNNSEDDINNLLKDVSLDNIYHPVFISFILTNKSKYNPKTLVEILEKQNIPKWKIHYIIDDESTISEMIDMSLDTNLNNTTASIIVIKYADATYKNDFLQRINELVSHCYGKKIVVLTDDFLDGFMLDRTLYHNLGNQVGVAYDHIITNEAISKIKIL